MTQLSKAAARAAAQSAQPAAPAAEEEQGGSRSVRRAMEILEFLLQQGEPATDPHACSAGSRST